MQSECLLEDSERQKISGVLSFAEPFHLAGTQMAKETTNQEYVLGTDSTELVRLRRQHELWKADVLRAWGLANFKAGQTIVDLGCGPGYTTLDLARFLGPLSKITAVDLSRDFLDALAAHPKTAAEAAISTQCSSLEEMALKPESFDGAFCRWVMIFVADVARALTKVHAALKPGGKFVLQEYVAYETMALCPPSQPMKNVNEAIFKSWYQQGADPNRGQVLPALLEQAGFKVEVIEPIARIIRPDDAFWEWPEGFFRSFLPRLEQNGFLTSSEVQAFFADWQKARATPGAFFIAPTMVTIVATKA
jgi:ubiquinone/menaquinone biosynthesis C-methylase UbiE